MRFIFYWQFFNNNARVREEPLSIYAYTMLRRCTLFRSVTNVSVCVIYSAGLEMQRIYMERNSNIIIMGFRRRFNIIYIYIHVRRSRRRIKAGK